MLLEIATAYAGALYGIDAANGALTRALAPHLGSSVSSGGGGGSRSGAPSKNAPPPEPDDDEIPF